MSDSIERIELSCSSNAAESFGWNGSWLVSSANMMRMKSSLLMSLKPLTCPVRTAESTAVALEIWLMSGPLS